MRCLRVLYLDCVLLVIERGRCCPCLEKRASSPHTSAMTTAMGACERYFPLHGLVHVERRQKHHLQEFQKLEGEFRLEVGAFFFFDKLLFGRLLLFVFPMSFFWFFVAFVFLFSTSNFFLLF